MVFPIFVRCLYPAKTYQAHRRSKATKVPARGGDLGVGKTCKCGQKPQGMPLEAIQHKQYWKTIINEIQK